MEIKTVKELYKYGVITGFIIKDCKKYDDSPRWTLIIKDNKGKQFPLKTALGKDKLFHKLDTVISEIESIGAKLKYLDFIS